MASSSFFGGIKVVVKHRLFSEKEIARAREMDMLSYMVSRGEKFKQNGIYFKHQVHDSLVLCPTKGYYVWNSRSGEEREDRSCIDLAMAFYNLRFLDAVSDILEHTSVEKSSQEVTTSAPKVFNYTKEIHENSSTEHLKKYLINERKINPWLISELIEKGYIAEDVYRNVIFKWLDPLNKQRIVGASKEGTVILPPEKRISPNRKRFKQIVSTGNHGFYFDVGKTPKINKVFFFEASIDALSYLSLKIDEGSKDIQNARFFSMEGLKIKSLLENYRLLEQHLGHSVEAHICVDNDKGGYQFFNELANVDFSRNGENLLKNDIPYDLVIPKKAYKIHRKIASEKGISWTWLAAIHKIETNFSPNGVNASSEDYHQFFDSREHETVEDAAIVCADLVEKYTSLDGKFNIRDVLREQYPEEKNVSTLFQLEKKIEHYQEKYAEGDYQIADQIPKDWNDLLVQKQIQKNDYTLQPHDLISEEESFNERRLRAERIEYIEGQ